MFNSDFAEKDKKEIEIRGVDPEDFQLFLDAIHGVDSLSDKNVENALALASYLGSSELEKMCMSHLAQKSNIPLKEQFQLAENHNAENLMIQVCSFIKDAYELDEVVPKDLDSFRNTTKNIVLQRSFELLGIRKPPMPPQPEDTRLVFEDMMNELLDQAELQNHHGKILADQAGLLKDHLVLEEYLDRSLPQARPRIQEDSRIHELMEELRNTHSPAERNAVRAQTMVVKLKHIYTTLTEMGEGPEHPWRYTAPYNFGVLYEIIIQNQRDHSKPHPSVRGNLPVDDKYREVIEIVRNRLPAEAALYTGTEPIWVTNISRAAEALIPWQTGRTQNGRERIPNELREISGTSRFQGIVSFVMIAREIFFGSLARIEEQKKHPR
ncbi:hypothetical protein CAEBREN_10793 [Caenorhabditis brenneri]|uniref:BTB domain-containing protein n=1 Tax=Caenorhabditis brenneri TaxID=135651 RepID=G0NX25_CAEBE|nr:hypothetical protein CAEBREN_10793 [Caenorhabditis brenneri]